MYYEHRAREPQYALAIVREALAELCRANLLGAIAPGAYRQKRVRFEHRLARLERKANGTLLDVPTWSSSPSGSSPSTWAAGSRSERVGGGM